jgi:hypothetical protein
LAPLPKNARPIPVSEGDHVIYFKEPQRQPYKVLVQDMEAFCKEWGLDRKKMEALGEGEISAHRGWERLPFGVLGVYGESGRPYVAPKPIDPEVAQPKKEAITVYHYAPEAITYTPKE